LNTLPPVPRIDAEIALTDRLAEFVARLELDQVPEAARAVARNCMMDVIGSALVGVPEPASCGVFGLVRDEGSAPVATVFGAGFQTSAAAAALANGTSAHALDFDDVSPPMRGHPSVVCAPPALALAESLGRSGAETLLAYIAGMEVTVCLAYAVGRTHYDTGWHSTGTLGAIGAAAAAAKILRLDAERTRTALAIAASMSSGLRCNFGTMTKPLHAGHAARNGVTAAQLAAREFTANPAALEAPLGFIDLYTDSPDLETAVSRLGLEWFLLSPGINLKRHPCCYGAHHAIDALLALRERHDIRATDIEAIDVLVAPQGLAAVIHDRPRTGLEGKFSIPYTMAAAVVDGAVSLAAFTDAQVLRPELQSLLRRVHCREAEGRPSSVEMPRYAEVTVSLRDGSKVSERVTHPRGSAAVPMSPAELQAKFRDCASVCLDKAATERAIELLQSIEQQPSLRDLMVALQGPCRSA